MFTRTIAIILAALFLLGAALNLFRHREPPHEGAILRTDGYGGTITLDLVRTADGRIKSLSILGHNETPSYINDPERFLAQFNGKDTTNTIELGKDIDGITGATVTSRAVTDAVHAAVKGQPAAYRHHVNPWDIVIPLLLLPLALAALLLKDRKLHWAAMSAGFIYFGLITKTMFSIVQVSNAALLHIPLFAINALWWITLAVSLLPAFIIGRIYCSGLCPFALVQEGLGTLDRRTPHHPAIERSLYSFNPWHIKYLILTIILTFCFIIGNAAAANIEAYTTLFTGNGTIIAWGLLGLSLIASVFYSHFWCRYLCPAGALLGICATIAPIKIKASDNCDACGACIMVCPVGAITPCGKGITINAAECILCGKCLPACKRDFLSLGRKG